jgi:hypothetical protein
VANGGAANVVGGKTDVDSASMSVAAIDDGAGAAN